MSASGKELQAYSGVDFHGSQGVNMRLQQITGTGDISNLLDGVIGWKSDVNRIAVVRSSALVLVPRLDLAETVTAAWTFDRGSSTPPFIVAATLPSVGSTATMVTNLNANYLSGYAADATITGNTIALRGSGGTLAVNDPVAATDAVNLQTAQAMIANQDRKASVRVATTTALPTNTISGNVLTASANGAFPNIDGVSMNLNDELLVLYEGGSGTLNAGSSNLKNGIYTITSLGSGGTPWQLTRRSDADVSAEVNNGMTTFVGNEGAVNLNSEWTLITADPITLNTTALQFTKTGGNSLYVAGNGMALVGGTFHFCTSAGYTQGDVFYAGNSTTVSRLAAVTAGNLLMSNGASAAPTYGKLVLSGSNVHVDGTSGQLPIANGGTNSGTSLNNGRVIISLSGAIVERAAITASALCIGDATNGIAPLALGTAKYILGMNAAGTANEYKSLTVTSGGVVDGGTWQATVIGLAYGGSAADLSGAATGSIIYKGASALAATGALSGIIKGNGSSAPTAVTGTLNKVVKWGTSGQTIIDSVIYDDGTNVGIGTTTPYTGSGRALEILGASDVTILAKESVSTCYVSLYQQSGTSYVLWDKISGTSTSPLVFYTLGAIKMAITSAGDVGIGTGATPNARLHSISTSEQLRLGYDSSSRVSFTVSIGGNLTIAPTGGTTNVTGAVTASGTVLAGSSSNIGFSSRTLLASGADGKLLVTNNAGTDFTMVQIGGTTSSFPAIKRSSAGVVFRLADDSADTTITASGINVSGLTASSPVFTDGTKNLTNSGTVGVTNGGIGVATLASNGVLYGNGTGAVQALAVNSTATKKFLSQVSSGAPAWATIASTDLPDSFSGFAAPAANTVGVSSPTAGTATTAMRSDATLQINAAIAPTWTAQHIFQTNSIGQTQTTTNGIALINTTAAISGTQQYSPALRFRGSGWKTASTAASQFVDVRNYLRPAQASAAPTAQLAWDVDINATGTFSDIMTLSHGGALTLAGPVSCTSITASLGIAATGNITLNGGKSAVMGYTTTLASSATLYTVTHNLGSQTLLVLTQNTSTGAYGITGYKPTDDNTIEVYFDVAPSSSLIKLIVMAFV